MADAIGILGFALHAAHKVYDLAMTIKDAPDDIEALRTETESVRGFLPQLIDILQVDEKTLSETAGLQFSALIEEARKLTEKANTLVDKAAVKKEDGSYEVTKAKWLLYARRARKLADDFRRFNQSLCAVNGICTACDISLHTLPIN